MENFVKISIETNDRTVTHQFNYFDVTGDDMLDALCKLMVSYGFHQKTVEDCIIEKAQEIESN